VVSRQVERRLRAMEEQAEQNAVDERELRQATERREQALLAAARRHHAATQRRNTM